MSNDFSTDFYYGEMVPDPNPSVPKTLSISTPSNESEWIDKSNDQLKKRGSPNRVINNYWHTFLIIFFLISIIIGIFGFLYLAHNDKFRSAIDNKLTCPPIDIPACPDMPEIPTCPACPDINLNETLVCNPTVICPGSSI